MKSCHDVRFRISRVLMAFGTLLALSLPTSAYAQTTTCGPEVKEEALAALVALDQVPDAVRGAREAELYKKYSFCIPVGVAVPSSLVVAARQCGATISQLGSIFFEEISCAGYDPQRRQFAVPIRIKQQFGFGASPLPGSREYVLNCVADPAGVFHPVGVDSVHLSNSAVAPSWQFAVIAAANQNLWLVQPMNGATRRARSILSWGFQPTGCNFQPVWGNAVNYRIRLDQ
ncbi:MAG TPA: hypothetical protein VFS23_34635 [Vicinamibacterales bacterium]|nr:hypothetical protein [Vicinamibacterales bacterium]